jgi:glycosyltransferase involved in cell wall biosynthesis
MKEIRRVLQVLPTPLFEEHFLAMTRHQMGLAAGLRRFGIETVIVTPRARGLPAEEVVDGARILRMGRLWNLPVAGRNLLSRLLPIRRAAKRVAPDLVHERFGHLWGGSGAFLPMPRVFQFDAPPEQYYGRSIGCALRRPLLRALFRRVDAYFCLTQDLRDHFVAGFDLPPERVGIVPDGVDVERFRPGPSPARARLGFRPDEIVVAFLGQFYAWHGAERIPGIAAAVKEPKVRWLLVGDGERLASVREEAARAGLGGRIVFTGRVPLEEAPAHLAAADLFVAPYPDPRPHGVSFYFSPLKVYEAMACGLPVIAPPFGELARLLAPDFSVAIPANTVEAYAAAIDALARDPGRRRAMAARARERAVAEHAWEARAEALLAVYRLAAERAGARGRAGVRP